ncbi:MAG: hypothetical protein DMF82_12860, partial [Acidobacteria bacterium]
EGWHRVVGDAEHGLTHARARDPARRHGLRVRGPAAGAWRRPVGHPERRRLRRVGSADRSIHRQELLAPRPLGQGGLQGGPARGLRPARHPRPADRGHHVPSRPREGLRRRGRRLVGPAPAADPHGGPRHGRTVHTGRLPVPGRARSRPLRRADRLRRDAGPQGRSRGRHVPDAVAVRAVRPHPDVQPALRHRTHRAVDR